MNDGSIPNTIRRICQVALFNLDQIETKSTEYRLISIYASALTRGPSVLTYRWPANSLWKAFATPLSDSRRAAAELPSTSEFKDR